MGTIKRNKKEETKPTPKTDTKSKSTKADKPEESLERYTRIHAIADTMRSGTEKVEDIITKADSLYSKRTGKPSNVKETKWNLGYVRTMLMAFNYGHESEGKLMLGGVIYEK